MWKALVAFLGGGLIVTAADTSDIKGLLRIKSSHTAPTCATATTLGELCAAGDIETNGALDVAGASTLTGATTQTGDLTCQGGAGALTFSDSASSIVVPDNDTTALDIGSTGTTAGVRYSSADNAEELIVNSAGFRTASGTQITGATTLDASDCGKHYGVTAAIDTNTITLPDADAVRGCTITFHYVGADAGALLDITPLDSDADGIEGGCYETSGDTVVYFSGTADADIGLTKATALTGDWICLTACDDAMWCVCGCQGIWANN